MMTRAALSTDSAATCKPGRNNGIAGRRGVTQAGWRGDIDEPDASGIWRVN